MRDGSALTEQIKQVSRAASEARRQAENSRTVVVPEGGHTHCVIKEVVSGDDSDLHEGGEQS